MKKSVKRVLSLMLTLAMTLIMTLSMAGAVMADDSETETEVTNSLKITNTSKTTHQFELYQIFTGKRTDGVLTDIEWGSGVLESAQTTLGDAAEYAKTNLPDATKSEDADTFANLLVNSSYLSIPDGQASVSVAAGESYTFKNLEAGYYLVKDVNNSQDEEKGEYTVYTKYIVQVVGEVEKDTKLAVPSVEKKVKENVKTVGGEGYEAHYNDVADYNIGDKVPFELIGTVPDMTHFTTYKTYTFKDTLGKGLTLAYATDVKVYVTKDKKVTLDKNEITDKFDVIVNGQSVTVSLKEKDDDGNDMDLKTLTYGKDNTLLAAGDYIIVKYEAKLNKEAEIGLPGNENEVYLEYSNNPNVEHEGEKGKTPTDKVIVFTYELDITKVDGDDYETEEKKITPLEGVTFKLYTKDENGDNKWLQLGENNRVVTFDDEASATVLKTDKDGNIQIVGLDDGTYYLKEVETISGYNKLDKEIKLVIKAETVNDQFWTEKPADALLKLELQVDDAKDDDGNDLYEKGSVDDGNVKTIVENFKGSSLPSTGGIGTKLFYIFGAILAIGAGIVLVTRRKMRNV